MGRIQESPAAAVKIGAPPTYFPIMAASPCFHTGYPGTTLQSLDNPVLTQSSFWSAAYLLCLHATLNNLLCRKWDWLRNPRCGASEGKVYPKKRMVMAVALWSSGCTLSLPKQMLQGRSPMPIRDIGAQGM